MNAQEYRESVIAALHDRLDRWGEVELERPGGPDLETIRGRLEPLLLGDPDYLAESGYHYVLMAHPFDVPEYALHVADGSQVIAEFVPRWGAPEWALPFDRPSRDDGRLVQHDLLVGADLELHGSSLDRLELPALADGRLPVLLTRYRDADGTEWTRESFACRLDGHLRSYMRLTAAGSARARIRTRDFEGVTRSELDLEFTPTSTEALIELDNRVSEASTRVISPERYTEARAVLIEYWTTVLDRGTRIRVADREITDAADNLVAQNLLLAEKYSTGNPYETIFMMEAHQALQSLLRFGHTERGTTSLSRIVAHTNGAAPEWYESWERGAKLRAAVDHYHLTGDDSFVRSNAATYRSYLDDFVRQQIEDEHGLLARERYAWDIPEPVYGFHSQAVAWRGMRDMISVLDELGELPDSQRYRDSAAALRSALVTAATASGEWLEDGSFFVPVALHAGERPHGALTESRMANYWNLVAPFAFAAGIFEPGSAEARGTIEYMRQHGAWMLGLTRFNGLYDPPTPIGEFRADGTGGYKSPGIDNAFGVQTMHFLADNDEADRLLLGLYAKLAHGMTPGTFVDGEATTVQPVPDEAYRSTWYPPNGTSNAMYLDTLRLMLARETWTEQGAPDGLHVLPATARSWLTPGESLSVRNLPTAFGRLTVEAHASEESIEFALELERRREPSFLRLHVRPPRGRRAAWVTIDGSDRVAPTAQYLDLPAGARTVIIGLEDDTD
jgi:hypothetical protein